MTQLCGVMDNGGRTFDRYTVIFSDGSALNVGPTGNVPNGVCMWADTWREGYQPEGKWITWRSVPRPVRTAAKKALAELRKGELCAP